LRSVYFGTSDFAASVLGALLESEHAPNLVVTRPARPKGRGKKLLDPPVAEHARARGVEVFQPEDVNLPESFERIAAAEPQAVVVCAFGAIVKEPLLSLAPTFNVHPSLLPRWRGAAPIERAILAGDSKTGVSIMRLVEELDAGDWCLQRSVPIAEDDDYGSLAGVLAALGGELLVAALDAAARGELAWHRQLEGFSERDITYAEKIVREDRLLNPREAGAAELARRVRALNPHIGAILETSDGDPLRITSARAVDLSLALGASVTEDRRLLVGTKSGALELLAVQPAGGRPMDVESFLRGNSPPTLV
jgi:methionyl-tRNA formyltransferase